MKKDKCSSGKVEYNEQKDAKYAFKFLFNEGKWAKDQGSTYRCKICKKWHLTSKEKLKGPKIAMENRHLLHPNKWQELMDKQAQELGKKALPLFQQKRKAK